MSEMIQKKVVEKPLIENVPKDALGDRLRRTYNWQMSKLDSYLLPKRSIAIPKGIYLEPTNKCNLRCGMCHHTIIPLSRIGEMNFDNFKKIIDDLHPYLLSVWLQGLGEPFLFKDIFKMIKYLKSKNIYVNTVTNATLLEEDLCNQIISSGLDEIAFSIDGATAETYEKIRVGASFSEVTKNIRTFTSLVEKSSRRNLKTECFSVAMKDNIHELPDLVTLVYKLGIKYLFVQDVQFQQLNSGFAREEESLRAQATQDEAQKKQIEQVLETALKLANKYDIQILNYGGNNILSTSTNIFDRLSISRARHTCKWPWRRAYVTWDGFVWPCCIPSAYSCGNLFEEPLKKVWNNKKYTDFRSRLKSGNLPNQCINCSLL